MVECNVRRDYLSKFRQRSVVCLQQTFAELFSGWKLWIWGFSARWTEAEPRLDSFMVENIVGGDGMFKGIT